MQAYRLKSGDLVIPHAITDEASGVIGDMLVKINDQDEDYAYWLRRAIEASPDMEEEFANVKPFVFPPSKQ